MNYEEKLAWLKTLKVGDEVYVYSDIWSLIVKIERISTNGLITTSHGKFKNGSDLRDRWSHTHIAPVTDAVRQKIRVKQKHKEIQKLMLDNEIKKALSESDVDKILDVLNKVKEVVK